MFKFLIVYKEKRVIDFVTTIKLNTNEPETRFSHKPRYKFITQTMLNIDKPETHLSHKSRNKFITQTMVNTDEPETYFCLINHVVNLSHKPYWTLMNEK